ncbi:pilus assembly protein TadG-related protein [Bradyrhizobium sp. DASA03120]|uniref:pilus assembly protein TadG-related protein n=1 Tax=Bradyrhizobium sp. SMVTL-02 TaxID=3395917 RepID=UPI003F704D13
MKSLLRCRRGSVALATVVALVPLIGVVALGAEAGSWYVTRQHAQNAADAAAIGAVWRLICTQRGSCTDTNSVDYRGKQFAAQNAFCNAGDTTAYPGRNCVTTLPTGISQTVQIAVNGSQVQATVSQQQPAYLAAVLGLSTVNIGATAVAKIQVLTNPCILSLTGSVDFQGSPSVSSPNCGVASNDTASDAFVFKGNGGLSINAPMFSAGGCSQTGGAQCDNVNQHAAPVPNPLSGLDAAIASLTTSNFPGGQCSSLKAYDTGNCYNAGNQSLSGTLTGTYYFSSGQISIGSVSGTATLILFGSATLPKITGNPTIQLTAVKNPAVPSALSSVSGLMIDLLIYDPETVASNKSVTILGNASSYFNGTVYVPNSPVTYGGNSAVGTPNPGCFQVIAKAVTLSGNTQLDNSKCISDGAKTLQVFVPRLVPS